MLLFNLNEYQYCSWCFKKTKHQLIERNYLRRNDYQCKSCGNYTVQCRLCQNMATHKPKKHEYKKITDVLTENWASEFCAEHDGTIASFDRLEDKLTDISEYECLFETDKWNWAKGGKITGRIVSGAIVFGPLAYFAAPGFAAYLGSIGALGTAGTGTAISSLSGAALTSASLAALGPGGMAGGVAFVTSIGAGLGGVQGGVISNNYFGDIKDFSITKIRDGSGSALIYINGFLTQKEQDCSDWEKATAEKYPNNPIYYVTWESGTLAKIGKTLSNTVGVSTFKKMVVRGVKKLGKSRKGLGLASIVFSLLDNPWYTSMIKASMTGILLADIIARTDNNDGFILMGHSLGARVIYYLLEALGTKERKFINDVY